MKTTNTTEYRLFATAAKGLEGLLLQELIDLGFSDVKEKRAGVYFSTNLEGAYRACLWSRLASRILLPLASFPSATPEALYKGIQTIDWNKHVKRNGSIAVHFVSAQSEIHHTLFGAQKVKDAIVDQFRDRYNERPNVDRDTPDINVYVYLFRDEAIVSLDLAGQSLHKRGYRLEAGEAPLKENLAAAILLRANWPAIAKSGGMLLDPMCGSGTLIIEAAFMAADKAPQLDRPYYGFLGWKQHDARIWQSLLDDATERFEKGKKALPPIVGYDLEADLVKLTFENIKRAGLTGYVHVEKRDVASLIPPKKEFKGLVVTNPPYGERLGEIEELIPLYQVLGRQLKSGFLDWQLALFTSNFDLSKKMGIRAKKYYALFNGVIPCRLFLFDIKEESFIDNSVDAENARRVKHAIKHVADQKVDSLEMLRNRISKRYKHEKRRAKNMNLTTYRIFDADLPEYQFAIDVNGDRVCVIEYVNKYDRVDKRQEDKRHALLSILPDILSVAPISIDLVTAEAPNDK